MFCAQDTAVVIPLQFVLLSSQNVSHLICPLQATKQTPLFYCHNWSPISKQMPLVGEHSCMAGGRTWNMCRWSYPIYSARYPYDQELFGSAGETAAGAEILDMPDQIMVNGIRS
jgi:hypothetical protein